ncbi:MAG: SET domain-containing protein-lysine N-methyltransferase [Gammaproteobacteria bacterium]
MRQPKPSQPKKVDATLMKAPEKQLTRAIQRADLETLHRLKIQYDLTELLDKPSILGASARRWALWRQHMPVLEQLALSPFAPLRIRDTNDTLDTLNPEQIAAQFHYQNSHYLCFEEAQRIPRVIRCLRILFKLSWLSERCIWLAAVHKDQLDHPKEPTCTVRFINKHIGYGVFAEHRYNTGEWIGEYVGTINLRHMFSAERDTTYIMEYPVPALPGYCWSIDARKMGNFTRFINHHDNPNCSMGVAFDGFILRLVLLARRSINPGQELTLDYGTDYWRRRPAPTL